MSDNTQKMNLWQEVGSMCLERALEILKREGELTMTMAANIDTLVNLAVTMDKQDMEWRKQNIAAETFHKAMKEYDY